MLKATKKGKKKLCEKSAKKPEDPPSAHQELPSKGKKRKDIFLKQNTQNRA